MVYIVGGLWRGPVCQTATFKSVSLPLFYADDLFFSKQHGVRVLWPLTRERNSQTFIYTSVPGAQALGEHKRV